MARSAGLTVDATVPGDLSRLPPPVSQEAYRIVQEGLTNALKYSADGTATLAVSVGRDALEISLSNPAGAGVRPAGAGGARHRRTGCRPRRYRHRGPARRLVDDGRHPARSGYSPVTAIRVLLADDEPLVRSGLRAILESEPDLTVVGEADDGAAVVAEARRTRPDIVLMDVRMPRVDGIAAPGNSASSTAAGPRSSW